MLDYYQGLTWKDFFELKADGLFHGRFLWETEEILMSIFKVQPEFRLDAEDLVIEALPVWSPISETPGGRRFHVPMWLRHKKVLAPNTPTMRLYRNQILIEEYVEIVEEMDSLYREAADFSGLPDTAFFLTDLQTDWKYEFSSKHQPLVRALIQAESTLARRAAP